jgi:DNA-binding GntR family transcriptional regulator
MHDSQPNYLGEGIDLYRAETLSRQAYVALRRAIRAGQLAPETMYAEAGIASMLGISRTPIREALAVLAREGLIEKLPQRGFRLRNPTEREIEEAYDLRALIEGYVVGRLASEAAAEDLQVLEQIVNRQEIATGDAAAFVEIGEEFHLGMPRLIGLERSRSMIAMLRMAVWETVSIDNLRKPERMGEVVNEHREVLKHLRHRDPSRASSALVAHVWSSAAARRGGRHAAEKADKGGS